MTLEQRIEERARRLGFTLFGIADPSPSAHGAAFRKWLAAGLHGEMAYLARSDATERRLDLSRTMASVRSVVVVGHEYYRADDIGADDPSLPVIARYARGLDYHDVVDAKLIELLGWIEETVGREVEGLPYVDTGPILERDLAARAGLGWFGKNTMLIHPGKGSYFLLGTLLLDVELEPSEALDEDRCGSCSACLDGCPTGALLGRDESGAPVIDAPRCISYLTIELKGPIPTELRPLMGNRVFGCDICQEVCPWNVKFAVPTDEPAYTPRVDLEGAHLIDLTRHLLDMSEKGYQRHFVGSPLTRPRRRGMLRNLCVALGNWGDSSAEEVLVRALADHQPLVRGHAAWALARVGTTGGIEALRARLRVEEDDFAHMEIEAALAD